MTITELKALAEDAHAGFRAIYPRQDPDGPTHPIGEIVERLVEGIRSLDEPILFSMRKGTPFVPTPASPPSVGVLNLMAGLVSREGGRRAWH